MTNRERQFLNELANGLTQKEIAKLHNLHIRTVEETIRAARLKLKAKTTTQAVARAIVKGLVDLKGIALVIALCWSCVISNDTYAIRVPRTRTQTRISRSFRRFD